MIVGHSALASTSFGGDGGPETPPVGAIALAGKAPADELNCPTAGITLSAPLGNGEVHLWAMDLYPTPTAIKITALLPRISSATASPAASIALAGQLGTPTALSSPPTAMLALVGLVPSVAGQVPSLMAEIVFSALAGDPFVGVAPDAATIWLVGLVPASVYLQAIPIATIALVGAAPETLVATSGIAANLLLTGAVPAPAILLRTGLARIWLSALPLIEASESGTGTIVVLNANTLAVSEYSIAALDVVEHEGEVYFVTAAGLSKLAVGAAPTAVVKTGMLTLGADEKKYIPDFKTTLSGDSTTQVWVTIELDGRSVEMGPYELYDRSGAKSFVRRMRLAGGVKADSVSFRFEGSAGTAWGLGDLIVQAELL